MALVVKTATSKSTQDTVTAGYRPPLTRPCGEALSALDAVYLDSSGVFMKADGTAADELALFKGIVIDDYLSGEQAVSAYGPGVRLRYADGTLTPGATLYLGATAGRLDTAATTGDAVGIAYATSDSDIQIVREAI